MLGFGKIKVRKEIFYDAKKPIKILDVNVYNIVISNLVETTNNSKFLVGYLHDVVRPLILIFPKISGYAKTVEDKSNNKIINSCLCI